MLFLATINYLVDPAKLFDDLKYEKQVAALLVQGNMLANLRNYDERTVQKLVIRHMHQVPDTVVFGSSRSMKLRSSAFPKMRFYNHSVSGATLADFIGLWQVYRQRRSLPVNVIIGIDPWVFNSNSGQVRWRVLSQEIADYAADTGADVRLQSGANVTTSKLRTLFSLAYLTESLKSIVFSPGADIADYLLTDDTSHPLGVKLSDGSVVSPLQRRDIDADILLADAKKYALQKPVYSLEGFARIDPDLQRTFENWFETMRSDGINITLLLIPYHPDTYPRLVDGDYRIITDVEHYLRQLANRDDIVLKGSFDPLQAKCSASDFTDGMHPRMACVHRLLTGSH